MIIGAITPTRGARPALLDRCKFYVQRQTQAINHHLIINHPPRDNHHDITERYRMGLNELAPKCDVVFFIEDDDYYPASYVETMIAAWGKARKPLVFGIGETYFYHPMHQAYWHLLHNKPSMQRACGYSTLVSPDILKSIDWRSIDNTYADAHIWRQFRRYSQTIVFDKPFTVGIKHGLGICGAGGHNKWFYDHDKTAKQDTDFQWLKQAIGEEDAVWYQEFARSKQA